MAERAKAGNTPDTPVRGSTRAEHSTAQTAHPASSACAAGRCTGVESPLSYLDGEKPAFYKTSPVNMHPSRAAAPLPSHLAPPSCVRGKLGCVSFPSPSTKGGLATAGGPRAAPLLPGPCRPLCLRESRAHLPLPARRCVCGESAAARPPCAAVAPRSPSPRHQAPFSSWSVPAWPRVCCMDLSSEEMTQSSVGCWRFPLSAKHNSLKIN